MASTILFTVSSILLKNRTFNRTNLKFVLDIGQCYHECSRDSEDRHDKTTSCGTRLLRRAITDDKMFSSFVSDTARPLAPQPYLIPSIYIVCILGPLLPRSKARSIGVTLAILYLCLQIPKFTYGEKIQDYMFPIQALQAIIGWLDMYIIHSPDEFHLNGEKIKVDEKVKKGWWETFKESWLMNTTNRGVGWNWEVKNVPKAAPAGTSRW